MNKRGQIFLIAAMIIIGIVIGLVTVTNSVIIGDKQEAFYDRGEEIKEETNHVLDYGVYQSENPDQLLEGFLIDYANYIAEERVLFLFGNEGGISSLVFEHGPSGSVSISTGGIGNNIVINDIIQATADVSLEGNTIIVLIEGIEYMFSLKPGQNFYFVIIKDENEESFVAVQ
jgi:hypothetical protein